MDSESSSADSVRLKGTSIVKPFVFGSISQNLKTKRENDNHTHDWTVYIKPFNNEDMSSYVKKVQFKLHETYTNPVRFAYTYITLPVISTNSAQVNIGISQNVFCTIYGPTCAFLSALDVLVKPLRAMCYILLKGLIWLLNPRSQSSQRSGWYCF